MTVFVSIILRATYRYSPKLWCFSAGRALVNFICIDMQVAVDTAAKRDESWPVGVETPAATWATNHTGQSDRNTEQDNPAEKNLYGQIGRIDGLERQHHCRDIGQNDQPEKPAPPPNLYQPGVVALWINLLFFQHTAVTPVDKLSDK